MSADMESSRGSLRSERKTISLSALLWRPLLAVVAPHRLFRQISDRERISWFQIILMALVLTSVCNTLHIYAVWRVWITEIFPTDWLAFTIGWTFYGVNILMLCLLSLIVLHRLLRGPIETVAPFMLASCYFVGGIIWITWIVDAGYLLLDIQPVQLSIPWLPWVDGPVLGNWMRLSHFVILPWCGIALWLIFRHVLHLSGPRQLAVALILAVVLPIAGRLGLYPLANLIGPFLWHVLGWDASGGWVILVTQFLVTILAAIAMWWLLHRPERTFWEYFAGRRLANSRTRG